MAPDTMEPIAFIRKQLEEAEPDPLRALLHELVDQVMSAEVDGLAGAGHGGVRPEHLRLSEPDRVFVHADEWAYCPAGRRADDHSFVPTGGLERRRFESGVVQRHAR